MIGVDDWKRKNITKISKGYHTLLWRYSKLNTLPLTEFMEAEIEVSFSSKFLIFIYKLSSFSRLLFMAAIRID